MEFTNLNFLSFTVFFILNFIVVYVFYFSYKRQVFINENFVKVAKNKFFYLKYIFLIFSFFIISFSVFWIKIPIESIEKKESLDIVFVLDVSKSMNVYDISSESNTISRIDFAKNSIWNFVLNNPENRYSLVIFAWEAISAIPLTSDIDIFLTILDWVDYKNLTIQWTDFNKAFELWFERLKYSSDNSRALIFISDWWDEEDFIDEQYLKWLRDKNKNDEVFIVWVWTETWWRIITWRDVFWRTNYLRYLWDYVVSRLNEKNLHDLSKIFKWKYLKMDNTFTILDFHNDLEKLEKKVLEINNLWDKTDFSRILSLYSFIFFTLFFILYIFEDKIFIRKK